MINKLSVYSFSLRASIQVSYVNYGSLRCPPPPFSFNLITGTRDINNYLCQQKILTISGPDIEEI